MSAGIARAGTMTSYGWGGTAGVGNTNRGDCGSRWDNRRAEPAGSIEANAFGIHYTVGNVRERMDDCRHNSYTRAPTDGSAWTNGGACA